MALNRIPGQTGARPYSTMFRVLGQWPQPRASVQPADTEHDNNWQALLDSGLLASWPIEPRNNYTPRGAKIVRPAADEP
jgi:hypothetical protein